MEKPKSDETVRREGRRPRLRAERAQILCAYRKSGLTQEKFAGQAGIRVGTLRGWLYRQPTKGAAPGGFAPVRIVGGAGPSLMPPRRAVTVRWPQGVEVEIAVELDGAQVGQFVRELLAPCLR